MTDPIKAKIQELCPDVMELKFGCELLDIQYKRGYVENLIEATDGMFMAYFPSYAQGVRTAYAREDRKVKILGSPITLAVVLRAIQEVGEFYAVDENGFFMQLKDADLERNIYGAVESCEWNLVQDNYDQQSDECKQFIGSLLNV